MNLDIGFSASGERRPAGDECHAQPGEQGPVAGFAGSVRRMCRISSIGATGAVIESDFPAAVGEELDLELDAGDRLKGRVAWRRGSLLGLHFDQALDLVSFINRRVNQCADERRRLPRIEVSQPALLISDGREIPVSIRDIAPGGVRIDSPLELPVGKRVTLAADGLPTRQATVRWAKSPSAGLMFDEEIAWPDLLGWLERNRRAVDAADDRALPGTARANQVGPAETLPVNLVARVREGGRRWEIEIDSLTARSVCFHCFAPIDAGTLLWLVLPGLEGWPARVSAVDGYRLTCEFLQPLHPAVLEKIIAQAG
ncbi:MAG: PilZ domain-containing protein [Sphingosinicella sp.]